MSYFESLAKEPEFLMLALKMSLQKPNFRLEFYPNLQRKELKNIKLSELDFLYNHLQGSSHYDIKSEFLHFKWSKL